MFARLMFTKVLYPQKDQYRAFFTGEMVPAVRHQTGFIHIMLLEPTEAGGDFIAVTEWESPKDAGEFERSNTYRVLMSRIHDLAAGEPVVKTYTVASVGAREVRRPLY